MRLWSGSDPRRGSRLARGHLQAIELQAVQVEVRRVGIDGPGVHPCPWAVTSLCPLAKLHELASTALSCLSPWICLWRSSAAYAAVLIVQTNLLLEYIGATCAPSRPTRGCGSSLCCQPSRRKTGTVQTRRTC